MRLYAVLAAGGVLGILAGCNPDARTEPADEVPSPSFAITTPISLTSVTAGLSHSCGLNASGTAYCWGYGGFGAVGNGSFADQKNPVLVSGGRVYSSISGGDQHTCAITTAGAAYCWGHGGSGRLGNGSTANSNVPVAVSGGLTFTEISAGGSHTCGRTSTGAVYCWGLNDKGQLGIGSTLTKTTPFLVSGGFTWSSVSAGNRHTCGIRPSNGAYCWGYAGNGALGDNQLSVNRTSPVAVVTGGSFTKIDAGSVNTCALQGTSGKCWGDGTWGQLGNGSSGIGAQSLIPTSIAFGLSYGSIDVGLDRVCAVSTGNTGYCWGRNAFPSGGGSGQLGDGTTATRTTPTVISGSFSWSAISATGDHSVGVTTGNFAYSWGYGKFGQLGNGTSGIGVQSLVPVQVGF